MNRMRTFPLPVAVVVTAFLLAPGGAHAQGVNTEQLPLLLSTLPGVEEHAVDGDGHLTLIAGHLTEPSSDSPHFIALRFIQDRPDLYPVAEGSELTIAWWATGADGSATVEVTQSVEGFWAAYDGVRCTVSATGVLDRAEGIVVHGGDVAPSTAPYLTEKGALEIALDATQEAGAEPPSESAYPVLHGANRARAWRVELAWVDETPNPDVVMRKELIIDAVSRAILDSALEDVTELADNDPSFGTPQEMPTTFSPTSPGCERYTGNPPGDFKSDPGVKQWLFSGYGSWIFDATETAGQLSAGPWSRFTFAGFPTYGTITRITQVPVGHPFVEFTIPKVLKGWTASDPQFFGVIFSWGTTGSYSWPPIVLEKTNAPQTVRVNAGKYPSWYAGTPVGGFFTRKLQLHTTVARSWAHLSAIDLYPGAHLELTGDPHLRIDGEAAETFGAGKPGIELHQVVHNAGCDLLSQFDPGRWIAFSMCKRDQPATCRTDLMACMGGQPPGRASVYGAVAHGASDLFDLCRVTLPPNPPVENLTFWRVAGFVETNTASTTSRDFELWAQGVPDLLVAEKEPVTAGHRIDGSHWTDYSVIATNQGFTLGFSVRSRQYDTDDFSGGLDVPVDIWARKAKPDGSPPGDWVLVQQGLLEDVDSYSGYEMPVTGLDPSWLPGDEKWTLLDVKVVLDPGNVIYELEDLHGGMTYNNDLEVLGWLPLTSGALDLAIPGLFFSDDYETAFNPSDPTRMPLPVTRNAVTSHDPDWGFFTARSLGGAEYPVVGFSLHYGSPAEFFEVDAVMVRYRQAEGSSGVPYLSAGTVTGVELPPSLDAAALELDYDHQYHTLFWQNDPVKPLGPLVELGATGIVETLVDDSYTAAASQMLLLGIDPACKVQMGGSCISWPDTYIDFIGVWGHTGQQGWDARPVRLMYREDGVWHDLPSTVAPHSTWEIGLFVAGLTDDQINIATGSIGGMRVETSGAEVAMSVDTHEMLGTDQAVCPLKDPGGSNLWLAGDEGDALFTVWTNVEDDFTDNNQLEINVRVGCTTTLTLPTAVTQ